MIWLGWVLWHINHCRLFNAKSSLYIYIKYIICTLFLKITFSNKPEAESWRKARIMRHPVRLELTRGAQWHFQQDNSPVHNPILVTDYLTKMGIKTVRHPPYSPDLAPCDFGYSLSSEAVVMRQLRR